MKMKHQSSIRRAVILLLAAGITAAGTVSIGAAGNSIVHNDQLPTGGQIAAGKVQFERPGDNTLHVNQSTQNAVITWKDFSIGANATVNFKGNDGFSTLNYVTGGNASQIYGKLNAANGNIYLVNPSGVQIGSSAQINVGSFYVSNRNLDQVDFSGFDGTAEWIQGRGSTGNAELMSLGSITASHVTFEGDRIVIDTDRLAAGNASPELNVYTKNTDSSVVLGYSEGKTVQAHVYVEGTEKTDITDYKYQWIKNKDDLAAIANVENLSGNYALRNSIDLTDVGNFVPIGSQEHAFKGKLDGLGYNIFGLTIDKTNTGEAAGLFGYTDGARIGYFNLISGSEKVDVQGGQYTGALIGHAVNTTVKHVTNTLDVTGNKDTGGLIGYAEGSTLTNLINTGTVQGHENAGGIVGSMKGGSLGVDESQGITDGETHNLGNVSGLDSNSYNIGGLVGFAGNDVVIGEENSKTVYNGAAISGGYNVGGIVGSMEKTDLTNVSNQGSIQSTGHTEEEYQYHEKITSDINEQYGTDWHSDSKIWVGNAGGIAGSSIESRIEEALNTGDVSSAKAEDKDYYMAGNMGGIVGRAEKTNLTNVTNRENEIRGAANVGGIAGLFTDGLGNDGRYTITNAINDGGDILATGAQTEKGFATENSVRDINFSYIGNIGGIVGYMQGSQVYIRNSANRGKIHSLDITEANSANNSPEYQAANAGGIVGKMDRGGTWTAPKEGNSYDSFGIDNSYNTGTVQGYIQVGGIVGRMHNGSIFRSYNMGDIRTTRNDTKFTDPLNLGGIVGSMTHNGYISQSYNEGVLGDKEYHYYARHIGGIAGNMQNGTIDTSYNTGDIYNGQIVNGGIVGWWYGESGVLKNVFNTGNITYKGPDIPIKDVASMGGIVAGAMIASGGDGLQIQNAYNLGTLRSISTQSGEVPAVGGIVGLTRYGTGGELIIKNVYTTGNIYIDENHTNKYAAPFLGYRYDGTAGSQAGPTSIDPTQVTIDNAMYIAPQEGSHFVNMLENGEVKIDSNQIPKHNNINSIDYANQTDKGQWDDFIKNSQGDVWRTYGGTTPILNAFQTALQENIANGSTSLGDGVNIQYGTAYNPLLNIITFDNTAAGKNISLGSADLNWWDSVAVYGGGLTVDISNEKDTEPLRYSGTLYSDGALQLTSKDTITLGSGAKVYGSSVMLDAAGAVQINGQIQATGSGTEKDSGSISITGGTVETYGALTSAKENETVRIDGIRQRFDIAISDEETIIKDPGQAVQKMGSQYAYTTKAAQQNGGISITAKDGDAKLLYGLKGEGLITSPGDVSVTAEKGDVYIDADLDLGGDLTLKGDQELLLDISNIGKHDSKGQIDEANQNERLHTFLKHFSDGNSISFEKLEETNTEMPEAILTVDMWNGDTLDPDRFDSDVTLSGALDKLRLIVQNDEKANAQKLTHIWISDAAQLNSIQAYADKNQDSNILSYNFALKNDVDASVLEDTFRSIGTDSKAYTGTFDGRDHRLTSLTESLFGTIGESGSVTDLRVYSSSAEGGMIAQTNQGTIDGVTGLGNTVTGSGAIGGLVGTNAGTIQNSEDQSTVIGSNGAQAGGLAGVNSGSIENAQTNSAVTGEGSKLGGIAGSNSGTIKNVSGHGISGHSGASAAGGIVGANRGTLSDAYNDSIVRGKENIGGIAGTNEQDHTMTDIANGSDIRGDDGSENVGGLVGTNSGTVTGGRNAGSINGTTNVGGLIGRNESGSSLANLENSPSASITGVKNVGGLVGSNAGRITAKDQSTLTNDGAIYGVTNVGGVAGENTQTGYIENVNNNTALHVKDQATDAQYFGGVVGYNEGTVANATNKADVKADGADYVGGVVGFNTGTLKEMAGNYGSVTGKNHVGGVIGENIKEIAGVKASNEGTVTAVDGGAGGIIAENTGAITSSTLTNQGKVSGEQGGTDSATGGVIGINCGSISQTSLINNLKGTVSGANNVGGLIGINSGTITGGQKDNANGNGLSYYGYQIINNGTVTATTGSAGGLIGTNEEKGALTGAYNTGTVSGSTNVGGIVGENAGTVDQVFAAMDGANGTSTGTVTGTSAVGGLIGSNTGTLSNAYAANTVKGNGTIGNLVGDNQSGKISGAYSTAAEGQLIGSSANGTTENVYTWVNGDQTGTYLDETQRHQSNSYEGFSFLAGTQQDGSAWKLYGQKDSQPILSIFLTETRQDPDGTISATGRDGLDDGGREHLYNGLIGQSGYSYWSHQIGTQKDNPNRLGYLLGDGTPSDPGENPGGDPDRWDYFYRDAPWDREWHIRERKAELHFIDGGMIVTIKE